MRSNDFTPTLILPHQGGGQCFCLLPVDEHPNPSPRRRGLFSSTICVSRADHRQIDAGGEGDPRLGRREETFSEQRDGNRYRDPNEFAVFIANEIKR